RVAGLLHERLELHAARLREEPRAPALVPELEPEKGRLRLRRERRSRVRERGPEPERDERRERARRPARAVVDEDLVDGGVIEAREREADDVGGRDDPPILPALGAPPATEVRAMERPPGVATRGRVQRAVRQAEVDGLQDLG